MATLIFLLLKPASQHWKLPLSNTADFASLSCKMYPKSNHFLPLPRLPSVQDFVYIIAIVPDLASQISHCLQHNSPGDPLNLNVIVPFPTQNPIVLPHFTQSKSLQRTPRSLWTGQIIFLTSCLFLPHDYSLPATLASLGLLEYASHIPTLEPLL